MKKIGILGSTGSVGSQALEVVGNNLDKLAPYFIKKSNSKKERNHILESIREFLFA